MRTEVADNWFAEVDRFAASSLVVDRFVANILVLFRRWSMFQAIPLITL